MNYSTQGPINNDLIDSQAKQFRFILLGLLLILIVIACATTSSLWLISDFTGEFSGRSPRLGPIDLSLQRKNNMMVGELAYGKGTPMTLAADKSISSAQINLIFATPLEASTKERYRRADFTGKFEQGSIIGTVSENGTLYPAILYRNGFSSLLKRTTSYFLQQSHK